MNMDTGNNDMRSRRAYVATMSLLAEITEAADEASLGDLALYLDAARYELTNGPWGLQSVRSDDHHSTFTGGISALFAALDELREVTEEEGGLAAIAAARMYLTDGIRHLDRVAERVAQAAAEQRRPRTSTRRVDWGWAS
jgi:hypothetical protein